MPLKIPSRSSTSPARAALPRNERLLLLGAVAVITIVALENLAVVTAMPTVARDLTAPTWYAVPLGVPIATQLMSTAIAGPWADRFGARSPLLVGSCLLPAGLALAGLAPNMPVLVVGRALQGLGGGLLLVPLYVLVGKLVAPARRSRFFAAFSAAWVVPSLVGPWVAGVIADSLGWRWIFLGITPLFAVAALAFLTFLSQLDLEEPPAQPTKAAASGAPTEPQLPPGLRPRVDESALFARLSARRVAPAALAAGIGAGALLVLSTMLKDAGPSALALPAPARLLIAGLALGAVGIGAVRFLPAGTWTMRPVLPALVAQRGLINAGFIATEAYIPLMLTENGWSSSQAGLLLTVGSAAWAVGAFLADRLAPGRQPQLLWQGAVVMTLGVAGVAFGGMQLAPTWLLVTGWFVAGVGVGLTYPTQAVTCLARVDTAQHGKVSSALQMSEGVMNALALAGAGAAHTLLLHLGTPGQFVGVYTLCGLLTLTALVAGLRARPETR